MIHFVERLSVQEGIFIGKVHKSTPTGAIIQQMNTLVQQKYLEHSVTNITQLLQYPSVFKGTQVIRAQTKQKGKTVVGESVRFLLPSGQSAYCRINSFFLWSDRNKYVKAFQVCCDEQVLNL